ncbi:MAG: NB-ARC domain-containing protein, partial [Chloroflexota bacterium]|nr:NB-ARC domain-containing protein [Chloroflexota bacterium]
MPQLALSLFGSFRVLLDGQPVTAFRSDKIRALFAYLALEADRAHRRDTLAGLFWPEVPQTQAQNNLRVSLHRLREALGDQGANPHYFQITHESVRFVPPDDYVLDVARFTHLFDTSTRHPHSSLDRCHACMRHLEEAAHLYRGDLLEGFFLDDSSGFTEWAVLKRESLHRQTVELLYHLASYHQRYGRWEQARAYAWRQLELEPWREEAHRQVMEILARSGERSAALAQYKTCQRILAEELGIEPDEETRRIYERILAMRQGPNHNLPAQLTSFVGRHEELAELGRLLHDARVRLLTVVGPGGIGKTRFALHAAEEQIPNYLHGVYVVELAGVRTRDALLSTIAKALGFQFEGWEEPQAQLPRYLKEKEILLVLDNCEHLLGEVALFITAVLASAPRVKVLATSRERLHLSGEYVFVVPPLTLPDPKHMPSVEQLT